MSALPIISKELLERLRPAIAAASRNISLGVLGEPNKALSTRNDLRFGNRGSLVVTVAGPKAGLWKCFESNRGGDILSLIRHVQGCDFQTALKVACSYAGGATLPTEAPKRSEPPFDEAKRFSERKALAEKIWAACEPLEGSPSEAYLARRGIAMQPRLGEALRFARSVVFGAEWLPAMVAAIRDVHSNDLIGVHLTAHDLDGAPIKREGSTLRRIKGNKRNGVVKLTPDDEVMRTLCIGEGIETTLSAMQHRQAQGWSMLDAGGLKHLPVLSGIETLTIAVDADKAGFDAARELTARWTKAGREVVQLVPKQERADFNDLIVRAAG